MRFSAFILLLPCPQGGPQLRTNHGSVELGIVWRTSLFMIIIEPYYQCNHYHYGKFHCSYERRLWPPSPYTSGWKWIIIWCILTLWAANQLPFRDEPTSWDVRWLWPFLKLFLRVATMGVRSSARKGRMQCNVIAGCPLVLSESDWKIKMANGGDDANLYVCKLAYRTNWNGAFGMQFSRFAN